jgi:hypothetical protein
MTSGVQAALLGTFVAPFAGKGLLGVLGALFDEACVLKYHTDPVVLTLWLSHALILQ